MIAGAEHCGPGGCKLRIAGVSKVFDGRRGKVVALEGINLNIRGQQGGMAVNDRKVTDIGETFDQSDFTGQGVIIKKGKKVYHRAIVK